MVEIPISNFNNKYQSNPQHLLFNLIWKLNDKINIFIDLLIYLFTTFNSIIPHKQKSRLTTKIRLYLDFLSCDIHDSQDCRERGRSFLISLHHFHPLLEHLDISQATNGTFDFRAEVANYLATRPWLFN